MNNLFAANRSLTTHASPWVAACLAVLCALAPSIPWAQPATPQGATPARAQAATVLPAQAPARKGADHIVAVVGSELVTSAEVDRRVESFKEEARERKEALPSAAKLREQALENLIDERVVLVHARDSGYKVDEPEIDRAVQSVATQNKLTLPQLRAQLQKDGLDYARFRRQVRDQMLVERVREREVVSRIRVSDDDIDALVAKERAKMGPVGENQLNIAQVLVSVPEKSDEATVAKARAKAETALARARGGEAFASVARELSDDALRNAGGEMGLKPVSRVPDEFAAAVKALKAGEVAPVVLKTAAGFHVLKLVERRDGQDAVITQTRARHILLRPTAQSSPDAVQKQLLEMKRQVETGARKFEDLAKQHSLDGTAEQGGDLGFVGAGAFVAEFEVAMNALKPGAMSMPVTTRFGIHLIQVVERKDQVISQRQMREQARNVLREQRFEQAVTDWVSELRGKAYVERREAP